jgi:hypothetical protein
VDDKRKCEIKPKNTTIIETGHLQDDELDAWENANIFIGQDSWRSLTAGASYDDHYLYLFGKVVDKADSSSTTTIYLDPQNKHYVAPGKGTYKISISGANKLDVYTGDNGNWITGKPTGIKTGVGKVSGGYFVEVAIPWAAIGGKPALNKRIGLNMALKTSAGYTENISANEADKPFTWCTLKLY